MNRPSKPQAPPAVVLAVWQTEDGRCEACKRPMDKRWAKVARLDEHQDDTLAPLMLMPLRGQKGVRCW
jgi:hypothetical protein